jgi:uncharacterized protein
MPTTPLAPTQAGERITTLDAVRGIAVFGIVIMNAVSYGLDQSAYFNIGAGGNDTWLDWAIGGAGEIFVDQKFMALFSMLFGAGIVLFYERARDKGRSAGWLSLWRNALLLGIGILHMLLWEGDILVVYAVCSVFLIALHRLPPRGLYALGAGLVLLTVPIAVLLQGGTVETAPDLGRFWLTEAELAGVADSDDGPAFTTGDAWLISDVFLRALGMMLIGVGLYRTGVITGRRSAAFYRRGALWGLAAGLPLSAGGFAWVAATDFSPSVAFIGAIPNTFATFPLAFAYLSLVALWNRRAESGMHRRVHAVGRMALTNYLTQTIIGVLVLRTFLEPEDLNRSWVLLFVVAVWAAQFAWSEAWLSRFRYGPFEWAWRCATYRSIQPLGGGAS